MKKRGILSILFLLAIHLVSAQSYPKNYFGNPLDPPFLLAGTFGEIRGDHFHSGLDLSTSEQEGKPVYAAADGYVSRIKISSVGFGKAIYISHPNGFTTVYGHLKKFNTALEKYIHMAQYEKESFEIELTPAQSEFIIKKGDVIAYSGNTGSSGGPHLHFEIRDGRTEEPLNPMLFGYAIKDTLKPVIKWMRVVPMAGHGIVMSTDTAHTYEVIKSKNGGFAVSEKDFVQVTGKVGFEFSVTDYQNDYRSTLGIYSMQLKIDTTVVYASAYDRFSFADTRYANAHIDYAEKVEDNLTFERCFRLPGDHLKMYKDTLRSGYFDFIDDAAHDVEFTVKDYDGNTSHLRFKVSSSKLLLSYPYQPTPKESIVITPDKEFSLRKPKVQIAIPPGALYDTYHFTNSEELQRTGYFSPTFNIGDITVPLQAAMTVGIKPVKLPPGLKNKALIVSFSKNGKIIAEGGSWDGEFLSAKTKHFGAFALCVDTVAPAFTILNLPAERKAEFRIKISDELSGIKSYRATVDGKWFLLEYDAKNNMLSGETNDMPDHKKHSFALKVTDERGNETKVEREFLY